MKTPAAQVLLSTFAASPVDEVFQAKETHEQRGGPLMAGGDGALKSYLPYHHDQYGQRQQARKPARKPMMVAGVCWTAGSV